MIQSFMDHTVFIVEWVEGDNIIGSLNVLTGFDNRIDGVEVVPNRRREGIATAMLNHAIEELGYVKHDETRTKLGAKWSVAVGAEPPVSII